MTIRFCDTCAVKVLQDDCLTVDGRRLHSVCRNPVRKATGYERAIRSPTFTRDAMVKRDAQRLAVDQARKMEEMPADVATWLAARRRLEAALRREVGRR